MCIVKWHVSQQKQLKRQLFDLTTVQHSGIVLKQCRTLSDQIVIACGAQFMCMAICHDAMAMDMAMASAIALAMAISTAIAMGSGVYCAAKSLVFMQSVGNLHGG